LNASSAKGSERSPQQKNGKIPSKCLFIRRYDELICNPNNQANGDPLFDTKFQFSESAVIARWSKLFIKLMSLTWGLKWKNDEKSHKIQSKRERAVQKDYFEIVRVLFFPLLWVWLWRKFVSLSKSPGFIYYELSCCGKLILNKLKCCTFLFFLWFEDLCVVFHWMMKCKRKGCLISGLVFFSFSIV
jgi:hypothetical protein